MGRQHHLLPAVLLRAQSGARAAGADPAALPARGALPDGHGADRHVFICGGIQGYQAGVGDLRAAGVFEWPLRVLLVIGGLVLATPGGGIMPVSNTTMELIGIAILAPTMLLAWLLVRRVRTA